MKRTTLTASLVGSAAAGLIAAAVATPALAQSTTYPAGTDCSAIQDSANRTECMHQMNESRQNSDPGGSAAPTNNTPGVTPGTPAPGGAAAPGAAPGGTPTAPGGTGAGGTGTGGTGAGGATQ
jgi:hypothetical protein